MIDNYPPGAANDPNAPYNKKDPVMIECEFCSGTGRYELDTEEYETDECHKCDGTGEIESDEDDL